MVTLQIAQISSKFFPCKLLLHVLTLLWFLIEAFAGLVKGDSVNYRQNTSLKAHGWLQDILCIPTNENSRAGTNLHSTKCHPSWPTKKCFQCQGQQSKIDTNYWFICFSFSKTCVSSKSNKFFVKSVWRSPMSFVCVGGLFVSPLYSTFKSTLELYKHQLFKKPP